MNVGTRVSLNSLVLNCDGVVVEVISAERVRVLWDGQVRPTVVLRKNIRPAET